MHRVDDLQGLVERYLAVDVSGQDVNGQPIRFKVTASISPIASSPDTTNAMVSMQLTVI